MLLLRKILFYIFLLIYFTICPWLILYTLGYVIDFKSETGLVKTGAVSIATLPEGAEIYIRNQRQPKKTPAVFLNLHPGEYAVRVEKPGYQSWKNILHVASERAVVLEKIVLLPAGLAPEPVSKEPFERILPLKNANEILLARGPLFGDLILMDPEKHTEVCLADKMADGNLSNAKIARFFTSEDGNIFWLRLELPGGRPHLLRGRIRFKTFEMEDKTSFFSELPEQIEWEAGDENKIYGLRQSVLSLVNLDSPKQSMELAEGVLGFKLHKQKVFFVKDQNVFRTDSSGGNARPLLEDTFLASELFGTQSSFRIGAFPDGTLLFLNSQGGLFSNRLPYWIARNEIQGFEYDPDRQQAAAWNSKRIGVLDFSKDVFMRQEALNRQMRFRWIFSQGESITQVLWVLEGTQLLFRDGPHIYLVEVFPDFEGIPRFLADADESSPMVYLKSAEKLFYRNGRTRRLMGLSLVPKREIPGTALLKTGLMEVDKSFSKTNGAGTA